MNKLKGETNILVKSFEITRRVLFICVFLFFYFFIYLFLILVFGTRANGGLRVGGSEVNKYILFY
jgi:hypothetical protein